jgi:TatD DNase family protein
VIHCFTGTLAFAEAVVEMGLYVSLPGIVTFKNPGELHEVARFVPADRLLVETDAPYLAPIPFRGRKNEPAYVAHTAQKVADLRGVPFADLAHATTANARRLFRLPDVSA